MKSLERIILVCIAAVLLSARTAESDIIVMFTGPDGNEIDFNVIYDNQTNEWAVYLNHTRNGFGGNFHIRSTNHGNDVISFIRCNLDDPNPVSVLVEPNPNANNALVKTVRSIYVVNTADIHVPLCRVTNDVESVVVDRINSIDAGGDISGPIEVTEGSIELLQAGGSITTDIDVSSGYLKNIEAGGAIGSVGTPLSITAHDYVRRVMGATIHAVISATGTGVPYGAVARVVTTSGDVTGSLTCERIVPIDQGQYNIDWNIAGDLVADVTCEWYLHSDFTIYVDGSLEGDVTFDLEDGLQGQIILNAADDGGEWNGTITVDEMTLSGPNYTQTSAEIGGGAVGLAPFNFHATNCVPADNATVTAEPESVTLSHYGPVEKYGQTSVSELKIIRHPIVHFCAECDETVTGHFTWEYAANGRDIVITPSQGYAFEDGYEYHITPVITGETVLRCQGVAGNPVVQSYNYNFKVDVP